MEERKGIWYSQLCRPWGRGRGYGTHSYVGHGGEEGAMVLTAMEERKGIWYSQIWRRGRGYGTHSYVGYRGEERGQTEIEDESLDKELVLLEQPD